jgi:hypothetical protein
MQENQLDTKHDTTNHEALKWWRRRWFEFTLIALTLFAITLFIVLKFTVFTPNKSETIAVTPSIVTTTTTQKTGKIFPHPLLLFIN